MKVKKQHFNSWMVSVVDIHLGLSGLSTMVVDKVSLEPWLCKLKTYILNLIIRGFSLACGHGLRLL